MNRPSNRPLIAALLLAASPLLALQSRVSLQTRGEFLIRLPEPWTESRRVAPEGLPPSIEFKRSGTPRGSLQITVMWSPEGKLDAGLGTPDGIRALVEVSRQQYLGGSVEKELILQPLAGEGGAGYYISATDRTYQPGPGQYPVVTAGALGIKGLAVLFTILSDGKDDAAVTEAMTALKSATIEAGGDTVPRVPADAFAAAEIEVPGQGWAIRFRAPPLYGRKDGAGDGVYDFMARGGRFTISLFVEPPAKKRATHEACRDFYWPKASGNPMIDQNSIRRSTAPRYERVQYDMVGKEKGEPFVLRNVNYYFAYGGKWIDVHISILDPVPGDEAIFAEFDRTLDYGPLSTAH